jgi:hypothetical protein
LELTKQAHKHEDNTMKPPLPITTNRYKSALELAHRLNRIYANEYRCYRYAVRHNTTQNNLDKHKKAQADLAKQIADKDKRNKVIDALYDLANYTYINKSTGAVSTQPKYNIKRAVKKALKAPVVSDTTPIQLLTQELLQHHLYYDQELGTFEWQTGALAGKLAGHVQKQVTTALKKQNQIDKTKLPRTPTKLAGYYIVSQEAYLTATARNPKQTDIVMQYYAQKVPRSDTTATDRLTRVPYYLKKRKAHVDISLLGTEYPAQHLAYLYMGAGGDWNYTNGLDNAYRVNTTTAPQGLRLYCHKTNKPKRMPCRDGNALNLRWENIKPDEISTATITKDPTLKKCARVRTCKRVYSYKRNIKVIKGHWVVHNIGSDAFYAWSLDDAEREFNRRLARVKGTKQRLRNGDILVTR